MSFAPPIPSHLPVKPQAVLRSLRSWEFDGLTEQRDMAAKLCRNIATASKIYDSLHRAGFADYADYRARYTESMSTDESGMACLSDEEKQALVIDPAQISVFMAAIDHETFDPAQSEDMAFMQRLLAEQQGPIALRGLSAAPDKLVLIADELRKNPDIPLNVLTGFPHSAFTPEEAAQQIKDAQKLLAAHKIKNPVTIHSVAHYLAWMDADKAIVMDIFKAEAQSCADAGFGWVATLKTSVHGEENLNKRYGADYFKSVYDMATLALETAHNAGLSSFGLRSGTGVTAAPPFNNFAPLDVSYVESIAPMMMALRDFNAEHGSAATAHIAGGLKNEKDIAMAAYMAEQSGGTKISFGGDIALRSQLLRFLHGMAVKNGPTISFNESAFTPYQVQEDNLPAAQSLFRPKTPSI